MTSESSTTEIADLTTAIKSEDTQTQFTLSSVKGAPKSLRTRLLEVGLISGTRLEATRNGSHYLIKLRGDTLLLRAEEASHLFVVC